MADTLSKTERSVRMALVRHRDTKPEMTVRRLVHKLGFRFRLHVRNLPGKPDLVFKSRKKIIFVHGCFWHRHRARTCGLARMPKSKLRFWRTKLEGNRARDLRTIKALRALGWKVLIVWECESGKNEQLRNKVQRFLEGT